MTDTNQQTAGGIDKRLLTIDERILAMEAALPRRNLAGTILKRVSHEEQGLEWCLALGPMSLPKTFFRGPTIEDVVTQAERAIAQIGPSGRLATDWDKLDVALRSGSLSKEP